MATPLPVRATKARQGPTANRRAPPPEPPLPPAQPTLHPPAQRERAAADRPYFNPEEHISEKREWARRYTQSHTEGSGGSVGASGERGALLAKPDRLFEHFCVVVRCPPLMLMQPPPLLPLLVLALPCSLVDAGRLMQWSSAAPRVAGPAPQHARPLPPPACMQGLPPTMNIRAVAADIKTFQRVQREAAAAGGGAAAAAAAMAAGGLEVMADTPREEKQRQYGLKGPAHPADVSRRGCMLPEGPGARRTVLWERMAAASRCAGPRAEPHAIRSPPGDVRPPCLAATGAVQLPLAAGAAR